MKDRRCEICDAYVDEPNTSPWCNYCGKFLCPKCEKKHNKDECRKIKGTRVGELR